LCFEYAEIRPAQHREGQKATFDEQANDNPSARRRRKGVASPDATALRPADATVSPFDLYVYLKARFGPPNDVMMVARAPGLENLIQWGYALTCGGHLFRLHGTSGRVEFVGERLPPDDWRALIAGIKQDFARFGQQMQEIRQSLTRWSLFINPFRRVQLTVFHFAARLRSFDIKEPGPSAMAMTQAEAEAYDKAFATWMGATQYSSVAGTTVRMLAPVVAEAFVNFVLFVLAKSGIRRDERLYRSLVRQEVDVRVRALHVHCDGFQRPVDTDAQPLKDFQTLMNGRNDFLHGNVDPQRLAFDVMFADTFGTEQTIPLFRDDRNFLARYLANALRFVEPQTALKDLDIATSFIEHVLAHLDDQSRARLTLLLRRDYLGRNELTGEIAQLFGDALPEAHMIIDRARRPSRKRKDAESKTHAEKTAPRRRRHRR
jgi:hypothetical protein